MYPLNGYRCESITANPSSSSKSKLSQMQKKNYENYVRRTVHMEESAIIPRSNLIGRVRRQNVERAVNLTDSESLMPRLRVVWYLFGTWDWDYTENTYTEIVRRISKTKVGVTFSNKLSAQQLENCEHNLCSCRNHKSMAPKVMYILYKLYIY